MPSAIAAEAINFDELKQALTTAPQLVQRNVKSELFRWTRRVRKKVIRERLSGAPGITGGQFKKGKHVQAFVTGRDLASLKAVNKISRILRVHEDGATIRPTHGEWLYLSKKTRVAGKGHVFARVRQVVIPARLGFEALWRRELPQAYEKVNDAVHRAMREAIDKQMKAAASFIQRVV
jgi:hypothetical protein